MAEMIAIAGVVVWAVLALGVMHRLGVWRRWPGTDAIGVGDGEGQPPVSPLTLAGIGIVAFFTWAASIGVAGTAAERIAPGSVEVVTLLRALATGLATVLLAAMLWAVARLQAASKAAAMVGHQRSVSSGKALGVLRVVAAGVVGIVLVLPWVWLTLQGTLAMRWLAGYSGQPRHELLRALLESGSVGMIVLTYVSAAVLTPVFEELLFRRVLHGVVKGSLPGHVSRSLRQWGAIAVASGVFAVMHDPWSWPAIFVLSLGLGYVYERTGSLMSAVVMHALFNATSITLALLGSTST